MTVTADVATGTIHGTLEIAAPPERVFRALTDPKELAAWWGASDLYTTRWELDLRVGGKWESFARTPDGKEQVVRGEFLAVEPPRVLSYTWVAEWDGFAKTTIRYELEPVGDGTRLTITHDGFTGRSESAQGHGAGWARVLGWMQAFVEAGKRA